MRIRPFAPADAPVLAELFYAAVHRVAALHYTPDQIRAWAPDVPPAERILAWGMDGRTLLVAVDEDDRPLAFGDIETDGHLDHLFCHPDVAGTGVTGRLYEALEATAVANGITRIFTEASEPARRFFAKQGFVLQHRRNFELSGVPIHNYAMEKHLPAGPGARTP